MSDPGDAPLTPAQDESVARLLADAGGPLAMPPDVRERMLAALAELADEPAPVVPVRARPRWPRVLLAAAAVLVVGYGVGTVAVEGSSSGSDSATSAGSADTSDSDLGTVEERSGASRKRLHDLASAAHPRPVRLSHDELDAGVRSALRVLDGPDVRVPAHAFADGLGCEPPPSLGSPGRSLRVFYQGEPATLVVRPLGDRLVRATVLSCMGTELDSTVVRRGS